MKRGWTSSLLAGACLLALATPAHAVNDNDNDNDGDGTVAVSLVSDQDGARVYNPEYFNPFAPQTALDMVEQIPGFTIMQGDQGQRGLGQASQNVLVNGQRISSKEGAQQTLARIPVSSVSAIRVVDGATLELPGLSGQVVDVIATTGGWSARYAWRPQVRERQPVLLTNGEASASGPFAGGEISLGFTNNAFRDGGWGPKTRIGADNSTLQVVEEDISWHGDRPKFTGNFTRTFGTDTILNLNGSGSYFDFANDREGVLTLADGTVADEFRTRGEDEWEYELGGDLEFAFGPGRLKLIGLRRGEDSDITNSFVQLDRDPDAIEVGSRFDRRLIEAETIARAEYRQPGLGGDLNFSLEAAYNSLDAEAELFVRDALGVEQQVALPGANATVSEDRYEAMAGYSRAIGSALTLQTSFGGEVSTITAGAEERSYLRPKGSIALAWAVDDDSSFNAKIERRVDQLSFFDFLAAVDLVNDTDRTSNFTLVPPERWRMELEWSEGLGEWGSIRPQLRLAAIEGIVDSVPVGDNSQALGNLDTAIVVQPLLNATLQFDPLGFAGAKLDLFAMASLTDVPDPLTGEGREISGIQRGYVNLEFRHDVPGSSWAWGGHLERNWNAWQYQLDRRAREFNTAPFASLFVEHKNLLGLTARATVLNVLGNSFGFEQEVYEGRRTGPLAYYETTAREFGPVFRLSLSGQI